MQIRHAILGAAAIAVPLLSSTGANAATIYGATIFSELVSFDSSDPTTPLSSVAISGLTLGSDFYSLLDIDFRPSTGVLYGLGNAPGNLYRLFTIDTTTGVASTVGSTISFTSGAFAFGFDFDPVTDQIRVVNNLDQNGRINPNTGVFTADTNLTLGAADPTVVAAAHSNSVSGATSTTLYDINLDTGLGYTIVYIQTPPNAGTLVFSSGRLLDGVEPDSAIGFDIGGANDGYLSIPSYANFSTTLYSVNPETGATVNLGNYGDYIRDIAVLPVPEPSTYALVGLGIAGIGFLRRKK